MTNISLVLAFSSGLLSFMSPCVISLMPGYISYLTGSCAEELKSNKGKLTTIQKSIGFIIGFSTIFILMGASASTIGRILVEQHVWLRKIGGLLIIIFGLHTIGILKIKLLYHEKKFNTFSSKGKKLGSVLLGMAFAASWTPCIGPIESSMLIYASNLATIQEGMLLLTAYSLGMAVPFIITALAIEKFTKYFKTVSKYIPIVSIISGLLMITMGLLIFTNNINIVNRLINL